MKRFLVLAATAAAMLAPGVASATLEKFDFSTTYDGGTYDGDALTGYMLLDVNGSSLATSGTLQISGSGLPVTETMGLVPLGDVYEAGDGTKLSGSDNLIPINANGIAFGTNAPGSLYSGYTLQFLLGGEFGECSNTVLCGFIAGPGESGNLYDRLGSTTLTQVALTQVAVPEPATWALMGLGFAALGFAGYRKARTTRAIGV